MHKSEQTANVTVTKFLSEGIDASYLGWGIANCVMRIIEYDARNTL